MSRQRDDRRLFTRRSFIFNGVKAVFGVSLLSRLGYLQIMRASHYKLLSDKNRTVTYQTLPSRGKILDSSGGILATNKYSYSVMLDLKDMCEDSCGQNHINQIIKHFPEDEEIALKLNNLPEKISNSNRFILLGEKIPWSKLSSFYILSSSVPGIIIEKTPARYYMNVEPFSHVLGYVGAPTKEEVQNSENRALTIPIAKIGKNGIEKTYEEFLFGKAGIRQIEVNSRRQFVRTIEEIESTLGQDIHLTINNNLQIKVYEILSKEQSASCIVMDVNTGAVLSFVSYPGYDLNIFNNKIDKKILKELYENPYKPMINKCLTGLYSPGSAFKMITGLAALHSGVINKNTRFHCNGVHNVGNYKYHCWRWKYGGHGSLNLQQAIARSCDVFFYNIAKMLSPEYISKIANDFGLGVKTGIDLPGEKSGLMPTKKWKKENKKQVWTPGDTINMSIGQGYTLTTPIQLTRMISIMVNGLKPVTPYIRQAKHIIASKSLNYKQEHIELILDAMFDVVNDPSGTAVRSQIYDDDFLMAGKTGSTQVFRITAEQRRLRKTVSDDYWMKEHAIFVGYAPADDPKYSVCVLVEHGGGGASKAAPIAKEVLLATRNILG